MLSCTARRHMLSCTARRHMLSCTARRHMLSCTARRHMLSCTARRHMLSCTARRRHMLSCTARRHMLSCTARRHMLSCTARRHMLSCCQYRPPPSAKNGLTTSAFSEECGCFIDQHVLQPGPIIVIGDLNFHLDDKADSDARRLIRSLDSTGMAMHVHGSTHRKGQTLLNRCTEENLVRNVAFTDMSISYHSAIKFTISAARCRAALTKIKYPKLRANKCRYLSKRYPCVSPRRSRVIECR